MIIDMRTYTHKPSRYKKFLKLYQETGYQITSRYLGYNMGLFTRSNGMVNTTIQLFAYENHDDRDECRRNYISDMDKMSFTDGDDGADGCIRIQSSYVIVPAAFSPIYDRNPENPVFRDEKAGPRILEWDTYDLKPGMKKEALEILEKELYPAAQKQVPYILGYFTSDSGPERIFELRAYKTLGQRTAVNEELMENGEYYAYYKKFTSCLNSTDSAIWQAMPMSPIQ